MFLATKNEGELVRIDDLQELFDPFSSTVQGRLQAGEEEQDASQFEKAQLMFPSGEALPRCWTTEEFQQERYTGQPF